MGPYGDLGADSCKIHINSGAENPADINGPWKYFDGKWRQDNLIKVTQSEFVSCPLSVKLHRRFDKEAKKKDPSAFTKYKIQDSLINGKVWYKDYAQNNAKAIWYDGYGHWRIGPAENRGTLLVNILGSGKSECPTEVKLWKYVNGTKWISDEKTSVIEVNEKACPKRIKFKSSNMKKGAGKKQSQYFTNYKKQTYFVNTRPWYKSVNGNQAIWWSSIQQNWCAGPISRLNKQSYIPGYVSFKSTNGKSYDDTDCPNSWTIRSWNYWDSSIRNWPKDDSLSIIELDECPEIIQPSTSDFKSGAGKHFRKLFTKYQKQKTLKEGRPWYKAVDSGEGNIFYTKGRWWIGEKLSSSSGRIFSYDENAEYCPDDLRSFGKYWQYWAYEKNMWSWWEDKKFSIKWIS